MGITVTITPEMEMRADKLAVKTGVSKPALIEAILVAGLEDAEDYVAGMERLDLVKSGDDTCLSSSEVRASLGLDH